MSSAFAAAGLARLGLHVFRLARGTKNHIIDKDWRHGGATNDPAAAYELFEAADYNIGVRTDGHIVVDVDGHKGGFDSLIGLPTLPETFKVESPRRGFHIYFRAPEGQEFANAVERWPGIDIKTGSGAYVVGPTSWTRALEGKAAEGEYKIVCDAPIAPAPQWLIDNLREAAKKAENAGQVVGPVDTDEAVASATDYLRNHAPAAVAGQGGNDTTYKVACRVFDRALSYDTALDLMRDEYNLRCDPHWTDEELEQIVGSALRNRQNPVGQPKELPASAGFEAHVPEPAAPADSALEFGRDIRLEEIIARESNAIVKGHVYAGECGTLFGESGAGKSFVALDMGHHIALGREWFGKKVRRTPVLYVALEGVDGFRKRMLAMISEFGDAGDWFARLKIPVSLAKSEEGAKGAELIVAQAKLLCARVGSEECVIIVDTKARATPGDDENSVADMSFFIEKRIGFIRKHTRAFVLTVHHANKNGDMRGSTALRAGDDLVLRADAGRLSADKVKDGPQGPLFDYAFKEIPLGIDADGLKVASCVLLKSAPKEPEKKQRAKPDSVYVTKLRQALNSAIAQQPPSESGPVLAPLALVRDEFRKLTDNFREDWKRAKDKQPPEIKINVFDGVQCMFFDQIF